MNVNDAELSVGIEDNLTGVLAKMASQVKTFGNAIGAEAKQIDKGVRQVTKSMKDLSDSGTRPMKMTALEAATKQLHKYQAEMERVKHAGDVTLTSSGRFQSVSTGRLVSGADITAYERAAAGAAKMEQNITRLTSAQRQATVATSTYANVSNEAYQNQRRLFNDVDTSKVDRSAATLQKVYKDMWGTRSQLREMWPPDMLKGPASFVEAMEKMPTSTRYALYDVAQTATVAGVAVGAIGVGAITMAAQFERAFADVQRTVQGTPAQLQGIRQELVQMSTELPVAFADLSAIASVGGQMGISTAGITNYTETIAKLTATTNLTADAASMALGRFKSFFAEASDPSLAVTDSTFENLASSILKVGVNSVATETGIVNVSTQISSMGSYAGFTANQVIGLAGSLSSIGVPPELSRGVITRLFNNIGEAASSGGTRLDAFARLAGTSAESFAKSWQTEDFAGVFTDMIAGLGDMARNGGDAVGVLHELGITSVRDVPVLLRLANAAGEAGTAGSLLAQTMGDAESGWRLNTELGKQYSIIASTLVERLAVLGNTFQALFASLGGASVGPAKDVVNLLITITRGFNALLSSPIGQGVGLVVTGLTLLAGAVLLTAGGMAAFTASSQAMIAGLTAVTGSAAIATPVIGALGTALRFLPLVGIVAALGGLAAGMMTASEVSINTAGAVEALTQDAQSASGRIFELGDAAGNSGKELSAVDRQSQRVSDAFGEVGESASNAAGGVDESTEAMFRFGSASTAFVKNTLLASEAFQNLLDDTKFDNVAKGADEIFASDGWSMDSLIEKVANGGREAGEKYLEGLTGVPTSSAWSEWIEAGVDDGNRQVSRAQDELLNQVEGTVDSMKRGASAAQEQGDAMVTLADGTQYATEVTEEFAVANEDALKKAGEAMAKFVDPAKLIKFTQDFSAANQMTGADAEEAASKAAKAWDDYYGGNSFKLGEYLNVFRGAAQIQEDHLGRLDQLAKSNKLSDSIIQDLRELGPAAVPLVQALVNGTDEQLAEYKKLYGQTGFDAMVSLAASQLQAQTIVRNAARSLGTDQMNQFTEALRAGTPLTDALKKWQLDANGEKLTVEAKAEMDARAERIKMQNQLGNGIQVPVTPYLTRTNIGVTGVNPSRAGGGAVGGRMYVYANGGFTGRGSKWTPAGIVHAGEVVTPQKDVDQRTGQIKPEALIRMLNGSRPARSKGPGYANGGFVQGGFGGTVELGAATIQAIARSIDPRVFLDGADLSRSVHNADTAQQFFGEG